MGPFAPLRVTSIARQRTQLRRAPVDIHEYQAKELLAGFGVAIPRGGVAYSPEQAVYRASEMAVRAGR